MRNSGEQAYRGAQRWREGGVPRACTWVAGHAQKPSQDTPVEGRRQQARLDAPAVNRAGAYVLP